MVCIHKGGQCWCTVRVAIGFVRESDTVSALVASHALSSAAKALTTAPRGLDLSRIVSTVVCYRPGSRRGPPRPPKTTHATHVLRHLGPLDSCLTVS